MAGIAESEGRCRGFPWARLYPGAAGSSHRGSAGSPGVGSAGAPELTTHSQDDPPHSPPPLRSAPVRPPAPPLTAGHWRRLTGSCSGHTPSSITTQWASPSSPVVAQTTPLHRVAGDQAVAVDAQEALGDSVLRAAPGFVERGIRARRVRATTWFCSVCQVSTSATGTSRNAAALARC